MKIAVCGDVHWSQYSSIVRKRGSKYSLRLENLIDSVNWFNEVSKTAGCYANVYLGDFFDKSEINAEECAALSNIKWSDCPQYFICGNHEMQSIEHDYSSAKVFNLIDVGEVIDKPVSISCGDVDLCFLPYVLESNRRPISEYFPINSGRKRILFSHNDIAGIQMGRFLSDVGFSIEEIERNFNLTLNGHLHNGSRVSDTIFNVGILSGMNFSEDATRYLHYMFIVDTDTLQISVYNNPFAFNFVNLNFETIDDIKSSLNVLNLSNLVCSVKCEYGIEKEAIEFINSNKNIIEHRVMYTNKASKQDVLEEETISELQMNHIETFNDYINTIYSADKVMLEELNIICK